MIRVLEMKIKPEEAKLFNYENFGDKTKEQFKGYNPGNLKSLPVQDPIEEEETVQKGRLLFRRQR